MDPWSSAATDQVRRSSEPAAAEVPGGGGRSAAPRAGAGTAHGLGRRCATSLQPWGDERVSALTYRRGWPVVHGVSARLAAGPGSSSPPTPNSAWPGHWSTTTGWPGSPRCRPGNAPPAGAAKDSAASSHISEARPGHRKPQAAHQADARPRRHDTRPSTKPHNGYHKPLTPARPQAAEPFPPDSSTDMPRQ